MMLTSLQSTVDALRHIPVMIRNPSEDEEDMVLFKADPVLMTRANEIIRILSADPDNVEEEEAELDYFEDVHAKVIALRRRLGLPIIKFNEGLSDLMLIITTDYFERSRSCISKPTISPCQSCVIRAEVFVDVLVSGL